jgi:prepilin-type processing-associated H-X9-DG protein
VVPPNLPSTGDDDDAGQAGYGRDEPAPRRVNVMFCDGSVKFIKDSVHPGLVGLGLGQR